MNTTSTTVPKNIVPDAPKLERTSRGLPRAIILFLSRKLPVLMELFVDFVKGFLSIAPIISLYFAFAGLAIYFIPWGEDYPKILIAIYSAIIAHPCVMLTVCFYTGHIAKWIAEIKKLSKEKP